MSEPKTLTIEALLATIDVLSREGKYPIRASVGPKTYLALTNMAETLPRFTRVSPATGLPVEDMDPRPGPPDFNIVTPSASLRVECVRDIPEDRVLWEFRT